MILLKAVKGVDVAVLANKNILLFVLFNEGFFHSTNNNGFAFSAIDKTRELSGSLEVALLQFQFTFYCRLIELDCLSMGLQICFFEDGT